jgi:hypothetical protein
MHLRRHDHFLWSSVDGLNAQDLVDARRPLEDGVDPGESRRRHRSTDQQVGERTGETEGGCCEEEADQQCGDRVCVRQTGELVEQEPGCGEHNTDQCGDVLDDDRPQRRVTRVPEEG